jgi:hypothetical protein
MASTPPYGARTPVYGNNGQAALGSSTPVYGSTTPVYGSTTPVYGATTPKYGATTPVYGATTPKYGATTPKYGATPPYGNTGINTSNKLQTLPIFSLNKHLEVPYPDSSPPFYNEVTPITEEYTTDQGRRNSVQLPIVTLPVGTVLFRGVTLSETEDVRYFYRDYIGDPYGKDQVCLSPTHNVFFYPFPYVSFGAHDIGSKFKCIQVVVLVKPMNIVSAIGPHRFVRAQTWIYTGDAPFKRCSYYTLHCKDKLPEEDLKRAKDAASYDNCLSPEYQQRTGVRGWMALAQLDTLKPTDDGFGPMAKYITGLSKRLPSAASELMAYMYKDFYSSAKYKIKDKEINVESSGYPEIALYPYSKHPGDKTILQYCNDAKTAENIITEHIKKDDLNYLPIAMITKKGVVNVIGGADDYFSYDRIQADSSMFREPTLNQQYAIEKHLQSYLNFLKRDGLTLPYYGRGPLKFDTRTGFFVLPQLVSDPVYSKYLIPLNSPKAEHVAYAYSIMVRNYSKKNMGEDIVINPEVSIPRNFIFSRPASMMNVVKVLKVQLPGVFLEYLAKGSELFKKEGTSNKALELFLPKEIQGAPLPLPPAPLALGQGAQGYGYGYGMQPGYKAGIFSPPSPKSLAKGNSVRVTQGDLSGLTGTIVKLNNDGTIIIHPSSESASALNMSTNTELVVQKADIEIIGNSPVSPAYEPTSPVSPAYAPTSPVSPAYAPTTPVEPNSPPYRPRTPVEPNSPPYRPRTPVLKGGAKTRSKRGQMKRTTRKCRKGPIDNYKTVFTNMWKIHADRKYKGK